jgi:ribokinase
MIRQAPRPGEVWVAQFETPLTETVEILAKARAAGARTVLNLAPFLAFPEDLLKVVDVAVLNEIELSHATGSRLRGTSAIRVVAGACQTLRALGAQAVVATLGARGAVVVTSEGVTPIQAFKAKVVDTTGAGDCFVGALAARLAAGENPVDAARYASAAASCSVEQLGAGPSMPTAEEVAARLAAA